MLLRAVLFDLGQTLLEYPGNTREFWYGYLRKRLLEMSTMLTDAGVDIEEATDRFVDRALNIVWPDNKINISGKSWYFRDRMRELLSAYGRSDCSDAECEALTDSFYQPIGQATNRYPETLQVLETLREGGLRMAIISNAPWDVPGRLLRADMQRWEIEGFFDTFVISGDVPWRKPNPEFMWAAARELGVEAKECLVVGDSLNADIAGAKAAGMRSVWVNRDGWPVSTSEPKGDWTTADLVGVLDVVSSGR